MERPKSFTPKRSNAKTNQFYSVKNLNSNQRGYNYRWQQASKQFLKMNPLCRMCEANNRVTAATCVDHIKPHKQDKRLFWDQDNWQPLCEKCHGVKSAREKDQSSSD